MPHLNSPHGKAPSFSGPNGQKALDSHSRSTERAFANMGAKNGIVTEIPHSARAGAFECDESCREYSGNPHDAAGPRGEPAVDHNHVPKTGLRDHGAGHRG